MSESTAEDKRVHKEQLYKLFNQIASAMANPHRLELLDLLAQAPRTVEALAAEAYMSVANTSQHLQRLKQARLVVADREGVSMRYRLADPVVARLWLQLRAVAEQQLADVERALDAYRHQRHEFEAVSAADLVARLRQDDVVLLDVRPGVEYEAGHIPGAISIPWDELEQRLEELPPGKDVVAYCRGPYCVYADEALVVLRERGWNALRLEEGVVEWEQTGHVLT